MKVLGICHDVLIASAVLLEDGQVVAGGAEERFNRDKRSRLFPQQAVRYCLEQAGCRLEDVDHVAVGWNPARHLERYHSTYSTLRRFRGEHLYSIPNELLALRSDPHAYAPRVQQTVYWDDAQVDIRYVDHHQAHAAHFFMSGFEEAAIFTSDGRGEKETVTYSVGRGHSITRLKDVKFPQSLGLFYGTFTQFLGYYPDADEWKVMALASFAPAENPYTDKVRRLLRVDDDGTFEMDLSYFNHFNLPDDPRFYTDKFLRIFGEPRGENDPFEPRHYQIAAAMQQVTEEVLAKLATWLYHASGGLPNLVLSGGTFMNSVFNGKVLDMTPFEDVFISSCPDDSGTSIGAALEVYNNWLSQPARQEQLDNAWGPGYDEDALADTLRKVHLPLERLDNVAEYVAEALDQGEIVGWFQGRMEFGQRALGQRSILGDPRRPDMKDRINAAVKYRESYRPFAPSVLEDQADAYFAMGQNKHVRFMERVVPVREEWRARLPAITHVDGTGRVQTVLRERDPLYYDLIAAFGAKSGAPVVLNTSFNLQGEPIVCTPTDAIRTFYSCGLDQLVLGNYVLRK